jgi:hypothetical protein
MIWSEVDDSRVAALDPLACDNLMLQVPQWNKAGQIDEMARAIERMCSTARLESRTYHEILAITRDIGILAGSFADTDTSQASWSHNSMQHL